MIQYNKLVRDLIPDIIEKESKPYQTRILSDTAYQQELIKKLQEEVTEFTEGPNLEELADILEVIHALTESLGADKATVEEIRRQKAVERGGFEKRILLEWVD
jgi:predicted house-cleaning noncanonical NTP pyrophosphatase (MazG superfamily)